MSKKRTSPESSTDKQTNEDSDLFQKDDNAKRAKLASLSNTTLHDLPMELIEHILVKAVAMEVMDLTRKNSEWKEAAEPVINRLSNVCSHWTSILTTNYFRNELHRTFDAEKTIRMEIVQTFQFPDSEDFAKDAIALKDELFILRKPLFTDTYYIHVYDLDNVAEVKDVIPLPGVQVEDIAACNVSNCLYLLNNKVHNLSILRLTKTDEHQYKISPMISGLRRRYDTLAVAANGNLVIAWQRKEEQRAVITVYGPNGLLQHETKLFSDVYSLFSKVIPKSNGNFVLVSRNDQWETKLTEIDMNGSIVRQYQSSLQAWDCVCQIDTFGRIALFETVSKSELLDSELNLLEHSCPQLDEDDFYFWDKTHYNAERNEVLAVGDMETVVISRFTEE